MIEMVQCLRCGTFYPAGTTCCKEDVPILKGRLINILVGLLLIFFSSSAFAWEYTTPLGITIKASDKTIEQYEKHWFSCVPDKVYPYRPYKGGYQQCEVLLWDNIQWDAVDFMYSIMKDSFCGVPDAQPTALVLRIKPISYKCDDEEANSYEMTGCIDGYFPSDNSIWIHLGDDSGQGDWPFYNTALPHELAHYFRRWAGSPDWLKENLPDYGECNMRNERRIT